MRLKAFIWKLMVIAFLVLLLLDLSIYLYSKYTIENSLRSSIKMQLSSLSKFIEMASEKFKTDYIKKAVVLTRNLSPQEYKIFFSAGYLIENDLSVQIVEKEGKMQKIYFDRESLVKDLETSLKILKISSSVEEDKPYSKVKILGFVYYLTPKVAPTISQVPSYSMALHAITVVIIGLIIIRYIVTKINDSIVKPLRRFTQAMENLEREGKEYLVSDPSYLKDFEEVRLAFNKAIAKFTDRFDALSEELSSLKKDMEVVLKSTKLVLHLEGKESFEEVSKSVLEIAVNSLPSADAGSVYVRKKGSAYLIAAYGYKEEYLKGIKLPPYISNKPIMANWNIAENAVRLPKELVSRFESAGATDIKVSLFSPIFYKDEIVGELWLDSMKSDSFQKIEFMMAEFFAGLLSLFYSHQLDVSSQREKFTSTLSRIAENTEYGKPYIEKGHSKFVSDHSMMFAKYIGLSKTDIELIKLSGLLHDIGKIAVPESIYSSKSWSQREYEVVKSHATIGYEILSRIKGMNEIALCILHHHERWDGKGYPYGLSKEEIPLCSRIISVINAFDSLKRRKIFGPVLSPKEALSFIEKNLGTIWDPEIGSAAVKYLRRFYEM